MKLKDSKDCRCRAPVTRELARTTCRAGYCTVLMCPHCGQVRMDWGPVACPHKKYRLRQVWYPAMSGRTAVAVKKNKDHRRRWK